MLFGLELDGDERVTGVTDDLRVEERLALQADAVGTPGTCELDPEQAVLGLRLFWASRGRSARGSSRTPGRARRDGAPDPKNQAQTQTEPARTRPLRALVIEHLRCHGGMERDA